MKLKFTAEILAPSSRKFSGPLAICGLMLCSCSQQTGPIPSAAPQATSPVSGQVWVNGNPAAKLQVACNDTQATNGKSTPHPVGLTDEDGKIEFSTYQKGDGVPAGDYILTFTWREWDPIFSRPTGNDRLHDRYTDAKKSAIRLTVKQGESVDLGTIELSTE